MMTCCLEWTYEYADVVEACEISITIANRTLRFDDPSAVGFFFFFLTPNVDLYFFFFLYT